MTVLKKITLTIILVICCMQGNGQSELQGLWYSSDSIRIYTIYQNSENKSYEGTITSTKKTDEQKGRLILFDLVYNEQKDRYTGFMRALNSELITRVTLKKNETESCLELKLSRGFFFPVRLRWYKCTQTP